MPDQDLPTIVRQKQADLMWMTAALYHTRCVPRVGDHRLLELSVLVRIIKAPCGLRKE